MAPSYIYLPDNCGSLPIQKETYILNLSAVTWEFGNFEPQHRFFAPKNCTILVCSHPLGGNTLGILLVSGDFPDRRNFLNQIFFVSGPGYMCMYICIHIVRSVYLSIYLSIHHCHRNVFPPKKKWERENM